MSITGKTSNKAKMPAVFLFSAYMAVFCLAGDEYPKKIISLGPSITEQLYMLGAGDSITGCTTFCIKPEEAVKKEKVASAVKVNIEKIVTLEPDLVLATSLIDPGDIEKLKHFKIKVVIFGLAKDFDAICSQFMELARTIGKEDRAQKILLEVENRVNSIRDKTKHLKKQRVFIQVGARPLFTMTENSYINDIIEFAGGINIAKDAKTGFYSIEEVLRKNPDVIIITTMGITGKEQKKMWGKYSTLKAVEDNRIHIVDSYKFCSPMPVSFVEALEKTAELLRE